MLLDLRMGMRRAQHAADELAGRVAVGAELGAAGDLVHAVGAQRPGADDCLNFWLVKFVVEWHVQAPLHFFGGGLDGAHDLVVAGAAAKIAGQAEADFLFGRLRVLVEQRLGRNQEARACRCRIAAPHGR